jgi:DNA-binding PadR family transcriptional regulator
MSEMARPRSPLWMVVLALVCEEPMHPYRMQALIKQRGKDQIANVAQRNSVYQTIDALRRAGFLAVQSTSRDERRPEKTSYEATEEGRRALRAWVRAGLATPAREFPDFPAVLSLLYGVEDARDLRRLLEARVTAQEKRLAELRVEVPGLPRLFLLDSEYMAAMVNAELEWIRGVLSDLASGELRYPTAAELRRIATELGGPSEETMRRVMKEMRDAGATREEAPRTKRAARTPRTSARR